MRSAISGFQDRHKIFLILLVAAIIFIAGCVGQTSTNQTSIEQSRMKIGSGISTAIKLSDAYNLAKPSATSKLGPDADMFNAITATLKEDGSSNIWIVSFCSPSQMKSLAVAVENGAVSAVSPIVQLNETENDFCEPLKPNRKDSSDVMAALPDAKNCIASSGNSTFFIYFTPQAENEEGWVWRVVCGQKYWDVDVYSGRFVASGELTTRISLPSIR